MKRLTICYLPSQWQQLPERNRAESVCVVIDVIRATTTIAAALASGALGVQPVASVAEAEVLKAASPSHLLAGERQGLPLPGFDLGNSPRSFSTGQAAGREIILTTTNGTQAMAACLGARAVVACALVNLTAVAKKLRALGPPWIVLCAGFEGDFGVDDAIVAGALADALDEPSPFTSLFRSVRGDLAGALGGCQAGRELVKIGLEADIPFCAEIDRLGIVPMLQGNGVLRAA